MIEINENTVRKVVLAGEPFPANEFNEDREAAKVQKVGVNGEALFKYPEMLYFSGARRGLAANLIAPEAERVCIPGDQLVVRGAQISLWQQQDRPGIGASLSAHVVEGTIE
jgi:hypothetical protein